MKNGRVFKTLHLSFNDTKCRTKTPPNPSPELAVYTDNLRRSSRGPKQHHKPYLVQFPDIIRWLIVKTSLGKLDLICHISSSICLLRLICANCHLINSNLSSPFFRQSIFVNHHLLNAAIMVHLYIVQCCIGGRPRGPSVELDLRAGGIK